MRRPLALPLAADGGGRRGADPGLFAAPAGRRNPPRVREQGPSSRRGPLLKPRNLIVKAVCDPRTTASGQGHQVHVHAKTALTVIFHRFNEAPVGRMARAESIS
jgi:hypothetical protein